MRRAPTHRAGCASPAHSEEPADPANPPDPSRPAGSRAECIRQTWRGNRGLWRPSPAEVEAMSLRKRMLLAPAALAALTARGAAQIPVAPTPPAPGFSAAPAGPPVVTIWDKLGLSKKAKEEC